MPNTCPVCGYDALEERPYSPAGSGSQEICPSCNFQFGYDDHSEGITFQQWRAQWIAKGMPWDGIGIRPPPGWNPSEQVAKVMHVEGGGLED